MEQKLITLKNGQIKAVYEYFIDQLSKDGKNAAFSYMIYKNTEILADRYKDIAQNIYNEQADTAIQEYISKARKLLTDYADRDEQGEVIVDEQGAPKITEQIVEYKTESDKLAEEYKTALDNRNAKIQESIQLLETTYEFNLYVIPIDSFPNDTAPAVVGMFGI